MPVFSSEAELEEFLFENWWDCDLGADVLGYNSPRFDDRLHRFPNQSKLIRQARVPYATEKSQDGRCDLVEVSLGAVKGTEDTWLPHVSITMIELKNTKCDASHLAQLCRYMNAAEQAVRSGFGKDNLSHLAVDRCAIYGVLMGPCLTWDCCETMAQMSRVSFCKASVSAQHGADFATYSGREMLTTSKYPEPGESQSLFFSGLFPSGIRPIADGVARILEP